MVEKAAEPRNIYQRMLAVTADVMGVVKDGQAPREAGGYKFVSHGDVTRAVRCAFIEHRVFDLHRITQHVFAKEQTKKGDSVFLTQVEVESTFVNADMPEDRFSVTSWAYGLDNQDRGPGKAFSYGVKYNTLKTLTLETPDDDIEIGNTELAGGRNGHKPPASDGEPAHKGERPPTKVAARAKLLAEITDTMQEFRIPREFAKSLAGNKGCLDMNSQELRDQLARLKANGGLMARLRDDIRDAVEFLNLEATYFDEIVSQCSAARPFNDLDLKQLETVMNRLQAIPKERAKQ